MWPAFLLASLALPFVICLITWQKSSSWRKGYWKKRGIPEIDASFIASELDVLLGQKDISERDDYIYQIMEKDQLAFCGVVESPSPIILLKDIDLIKKILIKDFEHFVDRRLFFGAAREDSVLRKMLGNLQGDEWKGVRSSVSPTFTTGKIRNMMSCINTVGQQWVKQLCLQCEGQRNGRLTIDVFNTVRQYTADVIASAIFGLDSATVRNPNSTFSIMARRLTDMNTFQIIKFTLSLRFPKIFQFFNIDFLDMEALRFFEGLLKEKLKERMQQNSDTQTQHQNYVDFLQLLVDAKRGKLKRTAVEEISSFEKDAQLLPEKITDKRDFLTDHVMSGQCLSFFFAGFRTTSHFLTFALYALALHPDVQTKLRKEVEEIFNDDEHLDYDCLGSLVYMDMVVCEVLRKYPGALRLERTCVSEYHDPESGLQVPKGTIVGIPLGAIHNDKKFYERPNDFYPEHFSPGKKAERSPYAFMPFGAGPRNCIGLRFALIESKAILAYVVHNFDIEPTEKTPTPLRGRRANSQISPPPHLELALIPRNLNK